MIFKEKFDEKNQEVEISNEEELERCKREKNKSLAWMIYGGALITGSLIVNNSPTITNEILQTIAGSVQSIAPLIGGFVGLDAIQYAKNVKRCNNLAQQIEAARTKEPLEQIESKEEDETVIKR